MNNALGWKSGDLGTIPRFQRDLLCELEQIISSLPVSVSPFIPWKSCYLPFFIKDYA